eukprot:gene9595-5020_t
MDGLCRGTLAVYAANATGRRACRHYFHLRCVAAAAWSAAGAGAFRPGRAVYYQKKDPANADRAGGVGGTGDTGLASLAGEPGIAWCRWCCRVG